MSFLFHYGDRIGLLAEHMDAISGTGIGVYRELESFKRARGLMSMALEVIFFECPFDHGRLSLNRGTPLLGCTSSSRVVADGFCSSATTHPGSLLPLLADFQPKDEN